MILAAASGSLTPGQRDRDLILALRADLRLGDAEAVDAVAHDRDRAVEVLLRQLAPLRRHGLLRDLEAALKVEAERRLLVQRRRRRDHQTDADERGDDQGDDNDGCATGHGAAGRLAAPGWRRILGSTRIYSFLFVVNLLYPCRELPIVDDELGFTVDDAFVLRRVLGLVLFLVLVGLDDRGERPCGRRARGSRRRSRRSGLLRPPPARAPARSRRCRRRSGSRRPAATVPSIRCCCCAFARCGRIMSKPQQCEEQQR